MNVLECKNQLLVYSISLLRTRSAAQRRFLLRPHLVALAGHSGILGRTLSVHLFEPPRVRRYPRGLEPFFYFLTFDF